jgi:DNA-binding protein HU-beta
MNKGELIKFFTHTFKITRKAADEAIYFFTNGVTEALKDKKDVNLVGFGKFYARDVEARDGRNPQTGAVIKIHKHRQPGFKAGQNLKDAVNSK